jgi:uncharacterized membrane protein YkvA (DUF1232 family)
MFVYAVGSIFSGEIVNWAAWQQRGKALKRETYALYLAYRDPRLPWYARFWAIIVVAYAFSPIDLIPDPIPVLGYLDDLILIPLGVTLAIKLIPPQVMAECRLRAAAELSQQKPTYWVAAGIIVVVWLLLAALAILLILRLFD